MSATARVLRDMSETLQFAADVVDSKSKCIRDMIETTDELKALVAEKEELLEHAMKEVREATKLVEQGRVALKNANERGDAWQEECYRLCGGSIKYWRDYAETL